METVSLTVLFLSITLIFIYISKENKSKVIGMLYFIFGGMSLMLFLSMLYPEAMQLSHGLAKFIAINIILWVLYLVVGLEMFGKLPNLAKKN